MYLFFSRFSNLSARRGNSRFLSLLTLPWYSMAETLRESPGVCSLDQFESNLASALTNLTGTSRRGNSRFFTSSTLNRYSKAETLLESPGASSLDGFESTKASALTYLTGTAHRGNSRFYSSSTLNRYSIAETLRESPGASSLDGFESTKASALTDLTATARRGNSRFFSSQLVSLKYPFHRKSYHHSVPRFSGRRYSSESDKMSSFDRKEDYLANLICKSIKVIELSQWVSEVPPREVFVIALIEDEFVCGLVDLIESIKSSESSELSPQLVELKLRISRNPISEAQLAINKFQVHMYQLIWDSSREEEFPVDLFLRRYDLNPTHLVSCQIPEAKTLGLQTFSDVLHRLKNVLKFLPAACNPILRYEYSWKPEISEYLDPPEDSVLLTYKKTLELGLRNGELTKDEWKCNFCEYRKRCPKFVGETDEPALRRRKI